MEKAKIYLSPPHMCGRENKYVKEAFDSNWIAPLGPNVDAFEQEMARYLKLEDAAAVSSGTAAIHLALSLTGVEPGDTVFCSTLTFVASANPILYQGAEPVFIDSEPESWNMSPAALKRALYEAYQHNRLPKAVIVVNLYGQSAKMDELLTLCHHYSVPVIEDAAESLGTVYQGRESGTFGDFGIFSFNGNKIITTSGGGMLVSNDKEAIRQARFLASQAREPAVHYQHNRLGFNYRMSNLLAGVGRIQLEVLGERVDARRKIFLRYQQALSRFPGVTFMPELAGSRANRWLTVLTIDETAAGLTTGQLLKGLAEENIEARPVWKPLHMQPLFEGAKYYRHQEQTDIASQLFESGLCLPSGSSLTSKDQERVIACIESTFNQVLSREVTI